MTSRAFYEGLLADYKARAEAAEADARRYRWLRDSNKCYWLEVQRQPHGERVFYGAGPRLDAAIDAELAKEAK